MTPLFTLNNGRKRQTSTARVFEEKIGKLCLYVQFSFKIKPYTVTFQIFSSYACP